MLPEPNYELNGPRAVGLPIRSTWRRQRAAALAIVCLLAFIAGARAKAQDAAPQATSQPATSGRATARSNSVESDGSAPSPFSAGEQSGPIQYVGPDTYILFDAEGRPQPVPGMTYEDFMAAWKRLQQAELPKRTPRFTIENVDIRGHARGRHAELQLNVTVRVLTEQPIDVPLGLAGAILREEARFSHREIDDKSVDRDERPNRDRASDEYLDYDPQRGGFVARLAGRPGERRTLSLALLVPLVRDGMGTTLSLSHPRTVSSRLTLDVDAFVGEANVTSGTLIDQEPIESGTRLVVAGAMGQFRLTWQASEADAAEFGSVLNAEGAIRVTIDGRSVRTVARLTVQSYGGSFDRFRVRLPLGAQLIQDRAPDADGQNPAYRISVEEASPGNNPATGDRNQSVLIELDEKQRGPVTVNLATEQPIGLNEADSHVELAGFEVLGAVRQFGDVVLEVASDWQARWDIGAHVRQVDPADVDLLLQQPTVTAAFQYDRQPWSLGVRVTARTFRILVTPDFELECSDDAARLTVHLTYQILGAKAFEFRVDLKGWELTTDPVESGGRVDEDKILMMPDGILLLPLTQVSSRRAEITFTVNRSVPRDAQEIRLPLPIPLADSVIPGELVVRAAPEIELIPDSDNSAGLTLATTSESFDADAGINRNEIRFRGTAPEILFAAERVLRTRDVSHSVVTSIVIDDAAAQVEQQVDYIVQHESIRELAFEVPEALALEDGQSDVVMLPNSSGEITNANSVEIPLSWIPSAAENNPTESGSVREFRLVLPQPQLGRFSLRIRYPVLWQSGVPRSGAWRLPLILPADGQITSLRATVRAHKRFSAVLDTSEMSSWTQLNSSSESNLDASVEFSADRPEVYLPLTNRAEDVNTPATTTVDRVWLQTWMSDELRQERAAFRFRTAGRQVAVELAPQTPDMLEVLLDGEKARVIRRDSGRILVDLTQPVPEGGDDPSTELESHTLELRYRISSSQALVARHVMTPHQMIGTTVLSEVYWHVVLAGDRHVIRSPAQMASAGMWQWLGSFWGRRPTKTQAELEGWIGAIPQIAPSVAHNEYLYTGLAPVSSIELVTAPRWLIVLTGSACVLAFVLVCIYVPILRRRWIMVALACLLACGSLAFPTPALLLAQASLLGAVLAMLAVLIARLVARPPDWQVIVPASGTHRHATPHSDSIVLPPLAATGSTAPMISMRLPESER